MFTIRSAQFRVMERDTQIRGIADIMRTAWPQECQELGDHGLHARIYRAVAKAATYGIDGVPEISRFVNLMFLLGEDFDTAKKHAWAGVILKWDASTEVKLFAIEKRAQEQG